MKEKQKKTVNSFPIIKRRANRLRGYLPIAIMGEAIGVKKADVEPGVNLATQRADDEYMIISLHSPKAYYTIGCLVLFIALFFLFFDLGDGKAPTFSLVVSIFASIFFLYGFTMPKQEIILDRQNGLFTYPGFMWGKAITIPFKDAVVNLASKGWPPGLCLNAYHPNGFTSATIADYQQIQTWNLFVWYMDRNRPLPPGTAFDPYRQRDYERRKKAVFPKPLYESAIPTPEWVPGRGSSIVDNLN